MSGRSAAADTGTTWRATLLATLSNLGFKGAMAFVLGGPALAWRIAPLFGASLAAGALHNAHPRTSSQNAACWPYLHGFP